MALHAAQRITRAGVVPTYGAAAAGDTVPVGDNVFLHVKNGSGGSVTLTVAAVGGEGGLALQDLAVAIPVGEKVIGPISDELFKNTTDGKAHLTWSSTTTVTFAVLQL